MVEKKHKKDVSHLKKYQFGQGINKPGRPHGARDKKTELTMQVLEEAMLIDHKTGKQMSAKQLKKRLSKVIWEGNCKVLLDVINRKLGKVPDNIEQTQRVIFSIERPEQEAIPSNNDKEVVIDGDLVQYELEENTNDNKE